MIWLCIRGAITFAGAFVILGGWIWLVAPMPYGEYGTPEYFQSKQDSYIAMLGGAGLLVCTLFLAALVWHYVWGSGR